MLSDCIEVIDWVLQGFAIFIIVSFLGSVYAATVSEDIKSLMDGTKEVTTVIFSSILGDPSEYGGMEIFFAKILGSLYITKVFQNYVRKNITVLLSK